jgi:hypothetical protein
MVDAYVLEFMVREQMAEAERRAERNQLLRGARACRADDRAPTLLARLIRRAYTAIGAAAALQMARRSR